MRRCLTQQLQIWAKTETRKPLIIDGARQVGKSHLVEYEFGKSKQFKNIYKFDFNENKKLESIFEFSLDPEKILSSLELEIKKRINTKTDLIFFDEIGECPKALESLKYFCEKRPDIFLISSCSNLKQLISFPIGKTQILELFPMNFYEFLLASDNQILIEAFENQSRQMPVHQKLWDCLLDYYFVGGMPEAVKEWYSHSSIVDKIENVSRVHKDLVIGYEQDFGKYRDVNNALHIQAVFRSIPTSLQKTMDQSVKRYIFKNVIPGKKQYNELRGPIEWLEKTKLVSKNYIIDVQPKSPLNRLSKENTFKLFFFDVGLLCHILDVSYLEIIKPNHSEKGFLAENFVQNELRVISQCPNYSWSKRNSKIEFLLKSAEGGIIPVEVKSGTRTRAKSLSVYKGKYTPAKTIKLIGNRGNEDNTDLIWPVYYAQYLKKLL